MLLNTGWSQINEKLRPCDCCVLMLYKTLDRSMIIPEYRERKLNEHMFKTFEFSARKIWGELFPVEPIMFERRVVKVFWEHMHHLRKEGDIIPRRAAEKNHGIWEDQSIHKTNRVSDRRDTFIKHNKNARNYFFHKILHTSHYLSKLIPSVHQELQVFQLTSIMSYNHSK